MMRSGRKLSLARALLIVAAALVAGEGSEVSGQTAPVIFHVGFTESSFARVNQNDAEAAFKVFIKTVGGKRGYTLDAQVTTFDDLDVFQNRIRSGPLHLAVISTWDYLSMDIGKAMDPMFVTEDQGRTLREYVLLTRRGAGVDSMAALRGRKMVALQTTGARLGAYWLESLLIDEGLGSVEDFFGSLDRVTQPNQAVLPVFFGKADACVVRRSGFALMKELNPQIGRKLQEVAVSAPLLDSALLVARSGWEAPEHRTDSIEALAELHEEPVGQQVLTLFKVDRLRAFEPDQIKSVIALRKKVLAARRARENGALTEPSLTGGKP